MRSRLLDQVRLPRCRVARIGALSIGHTNAVVYDTQIYDPFGMLSGGANPGRLVIPPGHGGEWEVEGSIVSSTVITVDKYWLAALYVNGVQHSLGTADFYRGSATAAWSTLATALMLNVGDYLELRLHTDNGTTALAAGASYNWMSARRTS